MKTVVLAGILLASCASAPYECKLPLNVPAAVTIYANRFAETVERHSAYDVGGYRPPPYDSARHAALLARLEGIAQAKDIELVPLDPLGQTWGISVSNGQAIVRIGLRSDLGVDGRAEVLAHEMVHAVGPGAVAGTEVGEVLADVAAYILVAVDGSPEAVERFAPYLVGRKHLIRLIVNRYHAELVQIVTALQ